MIRTVFLEQNLGDHSKRGQTQLGDEGGLEKVTLVT